MASKSSNGHIRKRQYQPSITSYLHRDANSQTVERARSPLSPPLPAETQASLLSVGMRVRKSVPEGYKTHKTLEKHEFPFPSTAPAASIGSARTSNIGASTRELLPFCGLHKTGGWAVQGIPPSSAPAAMQTDMEGDEALPGLTMSQTTISSTQGSFMSTKSASIAPSRKRTYEEEIEDELDGYFDHEGVIEDDESQPTITPRAVRPKAVMKGSSRKAPIDGMVHEVSGDDFDEAGFLVPDGMDVDEDDV